MEVDGINEDELLRRWARYGGLQPRKKEQGNTTAALLMIGFLLGFLARSALVYLG